MSDVEARLARLERENRRLKLAVAAGLIAAGIVAIAGARRADPPDSRVKNLFAEAISVVDPNGKPRITLAMVKAMPAIALADKAQRSRLMLSLADDGNGSLVLGDRADKIRLLVGTPNGDPTVQMFDRGQARRVRLQVAAEGAPFLDLADSDGKNRLSLQVDPKGWPGLGMFDPNGDGRITARVEPDSLATIFVSTPGDGGNTRVQLGAGGDYSPRLKVFAHDKGVAEFPKSK
jgi:hypothetical protein